MNAPDPSNPGANYVADTGDTPITSTTLDLFAEQVGLQRLDLIKVDVEGAEISLLRGGEATIRRFRPILMIEVNTTTLARFGHTPLDLLSEIGRFGYRFWVANRLGVLRPLESLPVSGAPNVFAFPFI